MRLRESGRAIILDPHDHVLLVHFDWPGLDVEGGFWANPGGGVEPGESRFEALRRELLEETGLTITALGPQVWTRTAVFATGEWDGQVDHVHLCRTERFEPSPLLSAAALGAENVDDIRWWSPQQLSDTDATFSPRAMPTLLETLRHGVPEAPVTLDGF